MAFFLIVTWKNLFAEEKRVQDKNGKFGSKRERDRERQGDTQRQRGRETDRQTERAKEVRSLRTLEEKVPNPGPHQAVGLEVVPPLFMYPALQGMQTHASSVPNLTQVSLWLRSRKDNAEE